MTQCHKCNKKISFFSFWKHYQTIGEPWTLRRLAHDFLGVPISHCPYCGEEIQATALTLYVFITLVVLGPILCIMIWRIRNLITILGIFLSSFLLANLWWGFFGKLKEPYKFPWEKD